MATARLIDSQKQELVRRFREGESTQALADHFGCSATTITRLVRAELGAEDYAILRDQRQRKAGRDRQIPLAIASEPVAASGEPSRQLGQPDHETPLPASPAHADGEAIGHPDPEADEGNAIDAFNPIEAVSAIDAVEVINAVEAINATEPIKATEAINAVDERDATDEEPLETESGSSTVLAIDDADDFADDGDSEDDLLTTDEDGEDGPLDNQDFHPVAVLPIVVDDQHETRPAPWTPDMLPSCAYLLVDKTVELQARPLGEIPELGRLPMEEQDQQALVLFTNPRQAKRFCGRTQRVIKLPDPALLGRTAPYLRAQGISRVVIEGALYALPGGQ